MRLTLRYHDMWWSPDITVLLNDEPLGGTKNGTYVERQYDGWSRNELQYMEYVYEFTLDKKSAISVYLNTSSADNWDIDLEAIEIPEKNTNNLSSNPYKTVMLNAANNWQYTWENLPQVGTSQDGEIIHYTYYIKEENLPGYESEIELISSTDEYSSYVVTNKRTTQSGFTMPATGSSGLWFIYIIGALLALIAFVIFVRFLVKVNNSLL